MAEFTNVLLARTMVEAQIAEAALQDAGIGCVVENFTSDPIRRPVGLAARLRADPGAAGGRGTRAGDHRGSAGRRAAAGL